jgi:hypothetical protein
MGVAVTQWARPAIPRATACCWVEYAVVSSWSRVPSESLRDTDVTLTVIGRLSLLYG